MGSEDVETTEEHNNDANTNERIDICRGCFGSANNDCLICPNSKKEGD